MATALMLACGTARAVTLDSHTLHQPEGDRHFIIATPDKAGPGKRPLIILLHGHMGSAKQVLGPSPLAEWLVIADREGLVVAAPDGLAGTDGGQGWNDCRANASNPASDDVAFISALIRREIKDDNVDPERVFVMGMSNGGIMSFRLAGDIGGQLAGFAAVSASMAADSLCPAPKVPVSALIISGTHDPLVPYDGGAVRSGPHRGTVIPVEESVAFWRKLDGLPDAADSDVDVPHLHADDPTSATRRIWGHDPAALQVEFLRIKDGGHAEPSPTRHYPALFGLIIGKQNQDVEAAEEAWTFFKDKRHKP
jgi:polyhydroxybutyrate depolymerase